jgi:magnesium transporter
MQHLYDKLDAFHLLDIQNATHPSMFVEEEAYDILIVTLPYIEHKELKSEAYAFVFDPQRYYYFDRKRQNFEEMATMETIYSILNDQTNVTMKTVAAIHESIDRMEEKLYDNSTLNTFIRYWLNYKKDLSRMHRFLTLATETLEAFIQSYLKEEDFLAIHFKDVHEHLSRTNRSVLLAIDKLGNLYNFYTSRNNERMNKTIYFLTLLSAIFLPLNLIVGYFGMNTQHLPFSDFQTGSVYVSVLLGVCASVTAGLLLYLRKKL